MSARRRAVLVAVLLVIWAGGAAGQARAYVRATAQGGYAPLYWKESCVPVTIYVNGFDTATSRSVDQSAKSVTAAAHTWSADGVSCADGGGTYLEIVPTLSLSKTPAPAAYDARNSIIFRTESWTMSGKPDGKPYDEAALAVTTVISRLDGHIVDADMEVNGVNKSWMNLDPGVTIPAGHGDISQIFDLQNTLTHEFGHLIGLDHTCFRPDAAGMKVRPDDDRGQPVPDCVDAPGAVENTVMFDSAVPGETSKRTLSADDARGVCQIYAANLEHEACAFDEASVGCAVAPAAPPPRARRAWGVLGVGLAAWLWPWRRRRARRQ